MQELWAEQRRVYLEGLGLICCIGLTALNSNLIKKLDLHDVSALTAFAMKKGLTVK